jgi:hypothetical protein
MRRVRMGEKEQERVDRSAKSMEKQKGNVKKSRKQSATPTLGP